MNPKSTANLDPKLRETYERVMGTALPKTPPTGQTQPQTSQHPTSVPEAAPSNAPKLQVQEVEPEPLTIPTPDLPLPLKKEPILNEMVQSPESPVFNSKKNAYESKESSAPTPSATNANPTQTLSSKKKNKVMPIFLTLGGLVFFVLYGVIWAKVFGLF